MSYRAVSLCMDVVCLMQFTQKSEQLRLLQQTLDEKRSELLRAEAKLRETEERFYTSPASLSDKVKDDLRVSVSLLLSSLTINSRSIFCVFSVATTDQ